MSNRKSYIKDLQRDLKNESDRYFVSIIFARTGFLAAAVTACGAAYNATQGNLGTTAAFTLAATGAAIVSNRQHNTSNAAKEKTESLEIKLQRLGVDLDHE